MNVAMEEDFECRPAKREVALVMDLAQGQTAAAGTSWSFDLAATQNTHPVTIPVLLGATGVALDLKLPACGCHDLPC